MSLGLMVAATAVGQNTAESFKGITTPPPPVANDIPDTAKALDELDPAPLAGFVNSLLSFPSVTSEVTGLTPFVAVADPFRAIAVGSDAPAFEAITLNSEPASFDWSTVKSQPFPHLDGLTVSFTSSEVDAVRGSAPTNGFTPFSEAAIGWGILHAANAGLTGGLVKSIPDLSREEPQFFHKGALSAPRSTERRPDAEVARETMYGLAG